MVEHIEKDKLETNVRYRFDYFSKFINFTSEDINALNTLAVAALPRMPVIVDGVYRKLFQCDITKHYFIMQNDKFDGSTVAKDKLSLDSTQMVYRKDMLSGYLKRLLLQREWTDEFLEYLSCVGRMHTNKMGASSIDVDYIHINATLTYIENLLTEVIFSYEKFDDLTKKNISLALNKVFRIQSDLFLMHYLDTSTNLISTPASIHKHEKCTCS
ncbi:unnamed protein product [Adineta ricciae]|uniref:Globin-sensor domain-containing protein n=1 Tax=Adineta ricciae TaxID=249248 RepID=A0A815EC62_ADIRI|nr:unnamed protein product [Adineta ricciae]